MKSHKGLAVHHFKKQADFAKWLRSNFEQPASIWLQFAKKGTGATSLTYEEAREVALCYGWIDGLINKHNEQYYFIKFSKRRPRSTWSKINREIVETLIKNKKMKAPGLAEVERAKKDGRFAAAYDSPKNMTVPTWFITKLKKDPESYAFFKTLNKANHYSVVYNLRSAKKEETRQRRAEKYLEMFKKKEKIY